MKRTLVALLFLLLPGVAISQVIPRLPGARPLQPARHDTTKDSTSLRWPEPDSIARELMSKPGYTVTRYQGDTAFFNAQRKALDLLAANKRRAAVERDSQTVVSDSGIYYTEGNRHVITGGNYTLSAPSSGQADIKGIGRVDYNFAARTVRISNASLPVNNGEMWYMHANLAEVVVDSAKSGGQTAYIRGGTLTSCSDSVPDYHFEYHDAKRMGTTIVARPAVLYVKDIPVAWLPFLFSDTKSGRHSGILPPQFGLGDIVRNSPTYRRNVDHVGYYWSLNDYMDFSTWLDWRSSAGGTQADPGWVKYNFDWDYKWINRFLGGRIGANYMTLGNGTSNFAVSWNHQQDFSHDAHLNTSINYVTNTSVQRQTTFNPYTALATISSQATYSNKFGPASLSIGATRKQYPGRQQVDQTFPTLSLTSTPISLGSAFSWTPSFSFSRSDVLHMDQPGLGQYVFAVGPNGVRDSSLAKNRGSSQASISFDTPITIFGYDLRNSFRINQQRNDFPQQFQIYDVQTGDIIDNRVFAATYRTDIDWTPDFQLPPLGRNKFNLTPSVSLQNVDPGPFWVATERTNGQYVHQAKRLSGGLSAAPTLYGFFPGFGAFSRIRHSITPTIGYSFAPKASVSDEYLRALGRTRKGYLGDLQQSAVTLGLTQNFQGKRKQAANDTTTNNAQPIDLLSINFTPITYDFERRSEFERTHPGQASFLSGITTDSWGYSLRSGLLPGFDFSSNYSLFQGSTLSDTAKFAPYLTNISASFNISRDQNPFAIFTRLFGRAAPERAGPNPATDKVVPPPDQAQTQAIAAQPVAGSVRGGDRFIVPPTEGWRASFTFSRSSPRPPSGTGNIIDYDPRARCQEVAGANELLLAACLAQQAAQPTNEMPVASTTAGGPVYRIPPTMSLNGDISFNLTPKWSAHWTTTYDFERHEFASHIVQLQRDIHDWRALFGFTQSPNGNFAFNFTIALKAEPDLKFDYNRATVRQGVAPF